MEHFLRQISPILIGLISVLVLPGCSGSESSTTKADRKPPPSPTVRMSADGASAELPKQLGTQRSNSSSWQFTLVDGSVVNPFEDDRTKAVALVFVATDCPIANAYQPLLAELSNKYSDLGIRFILIYPNRDRTALEVLKHADEFKIDLPQVLDNELSIADRVGAKVTPEAFLIDGEKLEVVYRGKIDNQYADYGKKRRSADQHFLADAINDLLANRPISTAKTDPIGCFISFDP